jgi:hypothetical protein
MVLERVSNRQEKPPNAAIHRPGSPRQAARESGPAGALKHGATSERKLAPLRAQHRAALLRRVPQLDAQRRSLLADLLARIELAGEFIDVHGLMRNTRQPHPVLELLSRWRRAWEMLSALEAEHRAQREPHAAKAVSPSEDLLDPTVRKHTTAALVAINDARRRRLGVQPAGSASAPYSAPVDRR